MSVEQKPVWPIFAGAALLGLIAGGIVLTISLGGDNGAGEKTDAAEIACALNDAERTILTDAAVGDVQNMLPKDPPKPLADLAFKQSDDALITIGDKSGKLLLVNLWATWCAPCREEMPALDRLQAALGGDDFEVVAISLDTTEKEKPKAFLEEIGTQSLGFYRDETMSVFTRMRRDGHALGLPATLLVGRDGCVIAGMNGPAIWDGEDAQNYIRAAMAAESL